MVQYLINSDSLKSNKVNCCVFAEPWPPAGNGAAQEREPHTARQTVQVYGDIGIETSRPILPRNTSARTVLSARGCSTRLFDRISVLTAVT